MNINGDEVIEFLSKKWGGNGCVMCGGKKWSVGNKVFELREFDKGNLVLSNGVGVMPVIPVSCSNCGNTIFVNALVTKLLEE